MPDCHLTKEFMKHPIKLKENLKKGKVILQGFVVRSRIPVVLAVELVRTLQEHEVHYLVVVTVLHAESCFHDNNYTYKSWLLWSDVAMKRHPIN